MHALDVYTLDVCTPSMCTPSIYVHPRYSCPQCACPGCARPGCSCPRFCVRPAGSKDHFAEHGSDCRPSGGAGRGAGGRPGATQGHWGWWCRPRGSGRELPGRGQHCACATEVPSGPLRPLWCPEPWRSSLTAQQISAPVACALPWY